ncbi:MAG: gamma carbonic anhydrase family protein [Pseudomonadota bacterium]|nr:gamma carbonic anhydrase family protein [Pseudomonadota bacterium]
MSKPSYHGPDNIRSHDGMTPSLGERVMIDPSAVVLGDLVMGDDVSVWPQCAIRADMHRIRIGHRTNIQDNSVLHITHAGDFSEAGWPLTIGDDVTVGHSVVLHGCTIGNRVLVGIGSIVMDGVTVEDEVMIGAGSLVTPGKTLKSGWLYAGSPAKPMREITERERSFLSYSAQNYVKLKNRFLEDSPTK